MFFSIVTPTYNRANLIGRVYESLSKQTFKDFEWIVIDDGSTDNTKELISEYKKEADFDIKYIYTPNAGKANALNKSIEYCTGFFYLVFDSDDWCDSDALLVFNEEWECLSENEKLEYAAISCLKKYKNDELVGDDYSKINKYGLSYIDRVNVNIKGDKWECLLLRAVQELKYPVFDSDKYMAPDYLWLKIAEQGYKTIFLNRALSIVEYQADGISKNNLYHRVANSKTTYRYYSDISKVEGLGFKYKLRMSINKNRFLFHSGFSFTVNDFFNPVFYLGFIMYANDKVKMGLRG